MGSMPWHHERLLRRTSDPPLRHRHRALQSWYREEVLGADYDLYRGRPVGNRLAPSAVAASRGLNFYDGVVEFAVGTVQQVRARGGTLEEKRLFHNMLSSMPLCFNIFGALRDQPALAAIQGSGTAKPATVRGGSLLDRPRRSPDLARTSSGATCCSRRRSPTAASSRRGGRPCFSSKPTRMRGRRETSSTSTCSSLTECAGAPTRDSSKQPRTSTVSATGAYWFERRYLDLSPVRAAIES